MTLNNIAGLRALTAMAGDPINTATGNFYYTKEDLTILGRTPLTFKRFYNAIGSFDGILGRGWTHNYNIRLFHYNNLVHTLFDDGHVEVYTHLENDIYIAPEEHKNTLRNCLESSEI